MVIYCPSCGSELPEGVAFCDVCGTPVKDLTSGGAAGQGQAAPAVGSVACPVCGAAALPGEAFCDNCGAALLPAASYPSPTEQAQPSPSPASSARAGAAGPPPPSYSSAPLGGYAQQPQRQVSASLVVTSPPPPATLPIPNRPELIVGRSDPQSNSYPDVDLGPYGGLDLGVSRRHFRLSRNGDQFYAEDLNAMNGTVINGQRIPPHTLHPLRPGDQIILGKMELRFEVG